MSNVTQDINIAVSELNRGNPVAIPTETVYGLAAIASNADAVGRVYALKNRPRAHPLIMHVHPTFDLTTLVSFISPVAKQLMQTFWPGPLTLVFEQKPGQVLDCVTGGQSTIAIRCPAHPLTQAVIQAVGQPLVAPSANPFGKVSPTTAEHVHESFPDEPLLIFDGGRCELGIESTIVSVVSPTSGILLRPGAIDENTLLPFMGEVMRGEKAAIRVPGQLKNHYQPNKRVIAFEQDQDLIQAYKHGIKPIFVMAFEMAEGFDENYFFQFPSNPHQVEFELYYQLRLADASNAKEIWISLPPNRPEWAAVRDRILKATVR